METLSFQIPVKDKESFEKAAKELNIDLAFERNVDVASNEWLNVHGMFHGITSLVGLAFVAGTNSMLDAVKSKFNPFMDDLKK